MTDLIIGLILVVILGSAVGYIVKQKKKGAHCIGCASSGKCPKSCCTDKK
ncbi:MAG: FeoB-associated Cys-rich membrane protein [Lachnospiraceae bacterium]|nr:FeoB-associated Cys-rich membrane protein [Lachnospiraceae bacterium]